MAIGLKLKQVIEQRGIKVSELAVESGLPAQTIYSLISRDSNKVSIDALLKICQCLNITVEQLQAIQEGETYLQDVNFDTFELSDLEYRLLYAFNKLEPEEQLIEVGRIEHMSEHPEKRFKPGFILDPNNSDKLKSHSTEFPVTSSLRGKSVKSKDGLLSVKYKKKADNG